MTGRRALLTDREREIVAGDADVSDSYRYQTISRVRARFDRLDGDLEALEAHGELAAELRERVCPTESAPTDEQTPSERRETAERRVQFDADQDAPGEQAGESDQLDGVLEGLDTTPERRAAVRGCVEHLREHGTAQKSGFVDAVYSEYPAGYGSAGGWWNTIGKEYLQTVADEYAPLKAPPKKGSHTWRWDE